MKRSIYVRLGDERKLHILRVYIIREMREWSHHSHVLIIFFTIVLDVDAEPLCAKSLGRLRMIPSIDVPAITILVRDPDPQAFVATPF